MEQVLNVKRKYETTTNALVLPMLNNGSLLTARSRSSRTPDKSIMKLRLLIGIPGRGRMTFEPCGTTAYSALGLAKPKVDRCTVNDVTAFATPFSACF